MPVFYFEIAPVFNQKISYFFPDSNRKNLYSLYRNVARKRIMAPMKRTVPMAAMAAS